MSEKNRKFEFWYWFGILSAFGLAIWGSLLLYNYLDGMQGPQIDIKGNYNEFIMPPTSFELSKSDQALEKDIIENMLICEENKDFVARRLLKYTSNEYPGRMHTDIKKYRTLWTFKLVNNGNKSISNAVLDLPFTGKYLMNKESELSELKEFNQQVKIGTLYASNTISIFLWTDEPLEDYSNYFVDNISFTFKGGSKKIDFPVEANGILGWSIRNQNKPFIFAIGGILLLLSIVMIIFYNVGINAAQRKQETVIEFGKSMIE